MWLLGIKVDFNTYLFRPQVSKGCFKVVYRLFQGCFKGVSRVFQGCCNGVSRVFQVCCKGVLNGVSKVWVSQGCFNSV